MPKFEPVPYTSAVAHERRKILQKDLRELHAVVGKYATRLEEIYKKKFSWLDLLCTTTTPVEAEFCLYFDGVDRQRTNQRSALFQDISRPEQTDRFPQQMTDEDEKKLAQLIAAYKENKAVGKGQEDTNKSDAAKPLYKALIARHKAVAAEKTAWTQFRMEVTALQSHALAIIFSIIGGCFGQ